MNMAAAEKEPLTRPLRVLIPLIQQEIELGNNAGLEHYRAAGEMLIEAKSQFNPEELKAGEWQRWLKRNFSHVSVSQVVEYIKLVPILENKRPYGAPYTSIREALGREGTGKTTWHEPVKQVLNERFTPAFMENLAQERLSREKEQRLMHSLAHQLIDIGYRVLASKLHPDHKGGSQEAMSRLNKVRKILKEVI